MIPMILVITLSSAHSNKSKKLTRRVAQHTATWLQLHLGQAATDPISQLIPLTN
jgi:hypothetical protein